MGKYLAIPGVILLILLVTLGARAESPDEFSERQEQESQEESQEGSGGGGGSSGDVTGQDSDSSSQPRSGETRYRYDEGATEGADALEPPTRISIGTGEGRIAIEPAGTEDNTGVTWDIDEPLPGNLVGYRQDGDRYFPVREGQERPGDVLISWDGDRLVLTEVDGGTTEIRRTDDGLDGSFTDVDGVVTDYGSKGNESVIVNPTTQAQPEDPGPVFGYDPSDRFELPFGTNWPWSLIGLITALTMFSVGMWLIFKDGIGLKYVDYKAPQRDTPARVATPQEELSLFDRLRRSEDADAVVRELYERATSGEWRIERRNQDETPLEFFNRVRVSMPSGTATELGRLSDLYSAVRFAPGAATLEDRDRAIEIAERLLDQMQLTEELVNA